MTTSPPIIALTDPGKSKHLRLRESVGAAPMQVAYADLRAATATEQREFRRVGAERFVEVLERGFGNLDKTYIVQHQIRTITDMPAPPTSKRAAPPTAKHATQPTGRQRGRR
ncbi:hypothetical protein [Curtobacterium sp. ISL-83]|uniref:hypothetical protein n=1 Tax=Curtobacterium sp. ISL-83 TaxID=2819145 RepID=UPI001BEA1DBB|nr:hypothetical protein [Curtobacterium sp. ISL-83]MBT2504192.1 hypothetical protein [Curtobacterium sp. ISL-83]